MSDEQRWKLVVWTLNPDWIGSKRVHESFYLTADDAMKSEEGRIFSWQYMPDNTAVIGRHPSNMMHAAVVKKEHPDAI